MLCTRFKNEPICDYSLDANVKAAERAIRALESSLDGYYPALIGGRSVETEKSIVSLCPALPDRVVGRAASCTRAHVDEAIAEAQKAFASWARTDPEIRAETLMKLAALIRRDRFDFLALLSYEIGKDWYEADAEIAEAIDFCEYYARLAVRHFQYQPLTRIPTEDNCFYYIPLGVGAVIAPVELPARDPGRHDHGRRGERQRGAPEALLRHAGDRRAPGRAGARGGRARRRHQPAARLGRRDRRLPGHAPAGPLRRLHRLRRRGPAHQRDRLEARPAAPLDDALHPGDGRQGRHRRGRDGRPGRGRERRGALGVRLPGAEVLGLLAPRSSTRR